MQTVFVLSEASFHSIIWRGRREGMFQVLATSITPLDQISLFVTVFPMVTFSWYFLVVYIHVESKNGTRPFHLCSCEQTRIFLVRYS